ncbi:MAG: SpoIIIAH-like family protein [Ruminococcus sp.]|nr:SpoIIIAH-like family protein [Candidatus Copronaster equi]
MIIKKKQLVTVALLFALGAAVLANWYLTKPVKPSATQGTTAKTEQVTNLGDAKYVSATTASDDTLAGFKVKRDATHDEMKETLNDVIKDEKSSDDAITNATQMLDKLTGSIKNETDIENLVTAKISKECVAVIDEEKCQVIVPHGSLNDNVSLQIKDIVVNQTKIPAKNITIIQLNG